MNIAARAARAADSIPPTLVGEHGLSEDEYRLLVAALGREPSLKISSSRSFALSSARRTATSNGSFNADNGGATASAVVAVTASVNGLSTLCA